MTGTGFQKAKELESQAINGSMLVLCGDRGRGKTQMATLWATNFFNSRYFRAHDLIESIRGKFSDIKENVIEATENLNNAKRCAYLVIDEFSELAGSEFEKRTLTNLIDHRYSEMLSTIIITNSKPEDAASELGRSAWSRLQETGGVILCDWDSYRAKKHEY